MKGMSRKKLLSSVTVSTGIFSLGNISGFGAPEPEKPALKKKKRLHRLAGQTGVRDGVGT